MDPDFIEFIVVFFGGVMVVGAVAAAIYGIVDWLRGGVRGAEERAGWVYDEGATTLSDLGCSELPQFYIFGRECPSLSRRVVDGVDTVVVSVEPMFENGPRGSMHCFRLPGRSLPRFLIHRRPESAFGLGRAEVEFWILKAHLRLEEVRRVQLEDNPGFSQFFDVLLFEGRLSRRGEMYFGETSEKAHALEQLRREADAQEAVLRHVLNREVQDFFMLRRDASWHFEGGGEWVGILDATLVNQAGMPSRYVEETRTLLYEQLARVTAKEGGAKP